MNLKVRFRHVALWALLVVAHLGFGQELRLLGSFPYEPIVNGKEVTSAPGIRSIDLLVDRQSGQAIAIRRPRQGMILVQTFNADLSPRSPQLFDLGSFKFDGISANAAYLDGNRFQVLVTLTKGDKLMYAVLSHDILTGFTDLQQLIYKASTLTSGAPEAAKVWSSFAFEKQFYILTLLPVSKKMSIQVFKGAQEVNRKHLNITKANSSHLGYYQGGSPFYKPFITFGITFIEKQGTFFVSPPSDLAIIPCGSELYMYRTSWNVAPDTTKKDPYSLPGVFHLTAKSDTVPYIPLPINRLRFFGDLRLALQDSVAVFSALTPSRLHVLSVSVRRPDVALAKFSIASTDTIGKQLQYYRRRSDAALPTTATREKDKYKARTNDNLFSLFTSGGYYRTYLTRDSSGQSLLYFTSGRLAFFNYQSIYRSFSLRLSAPTYDLDRSNPGGSIDPNRLVLPKDQQLPTSLNMAGSSMDELPNGDRLIISLDQAKRVYNVYRLVLD